MQPRSICRPAHGLQLGLHIPYDVLIKCVVHRRLINDVRQATTTCMDQADQMCRTSAPKCGEAYMDANLSCHRKTSSVGSVKCMTMQVLRAANVTVVLQGSTFSNWLYHYRLADGVPEERNLRVLPPAFLGKKRDDLQAATAAARRKERDAQTLYR
jgi:hypothetical protein